jgi:hypothetical protein
MVAMVIASWSPAKAASIQLICDGKLTVMRNMRVIRELRTVSIDLNAKTVTLEAAGSAPTDEMREDKVLFSQPNAVIFGRQPVSGLLWGEINRISGAIYAHIGTSTDGMYVYEGACKPAQKLF